MALKFMLPNLEDLDEGVAALYTKHDDGKFYLEVDGAVAKTRLDEFRNNNVDLLKKLEGFDGIDPDTYTKLVKDAADREKEKLVPSDQVDILVAERVKKMQEEAAASVAGMQTTLDVTNRQLESLVIDSAVRKVSSDSKVLPSAVDDVLLRAKSVFKVENGKAIPYDNDAKIIYGTNGTDPMTVTEWMSGLVKDATHLFEQSTGGGGPGGGGPGGKKTDPSKLSPVQKISEVLAQK